MTRPILTLLLVALASSWTGPRVVAAEPEPSGEVGTVLLGGTLSYVDPKYGPEYLALPFPRGTVATICGPGGCVTRRSTDYGPGARPPEPDRGPVGGRFCPRLWRAAVGRFVSRDRGVGAAGRAGRRPDACRGWRADLAADGYGAMTAYLHLTSGGVPFWVTPIIGTMRCRIPVLPGGDGAETEALEARTDRCSHRASCLIGEGPVCGHHFAGFFRVAGTTPKWTPEPCP